MNKAFHLTAVFAIALNSVPAALAAPDFGVKTAQSVSVELSGGRTVFRRRDEHL